MRKREFQNIPLLYKKYEIKNVTPKEKYIKLIITKIKVSMLKMIKINIMVCEIFYQTDLILLYTIQ